MTLSLESIPVYDLDIFITPCNVHRDLHIYVQYVQERTVKRATRSNRLSKSDARRLAKLMSDPEAIDEVKTEGGSVWVDFIDGLALDLGLVKYKTKGVYAGYSSVEPSYPDNYIEPQGDAYRKFCALPPVEQEGRILKALNQQGDYSHNEFYSSSVFGRSTRFQPWGSATGVMPFLDFPGIRRFLLDLLAQCEPGVWYSTASLVAYLKREHPYFLIPKKPKFKYNRGGSRYQNFHEGKSYWGREIEILPDDPDAFERVEGRYVERFLEGIPLTLGYVDVAYSQGEYKGLYPTRDLVRGFRVNERFVRFMSGHLAPPRMTVQPNFEIHVEAEVYPISIISRLRPLTRVIAEDTVTILKLEKKQVIAAVAEDDSLDVLALLAELSDRPLPQNIVVEVREWAGHSDKFVLYEGAGLLESTEPLSLADPWTVETISPTLRIVRSPGKLYQALEQRELVPLRVRHPNMRLATVPEKAHSVFRRRQPAVVRSRQKQPLLLRRQIVITLYFTDGKARERLRKALANARVPVQAPPTELTLSYAQQYDDRVREVLKQLEDDYKITIEDVQF